MKYVDVEVVCRRLKYSPNGWDNAIAEKGEEIELPEKTAKALASLDPAMVAILEEGKKPEVFHNDEDIAEAEASPTVDEEEAEAMAEAEMVARIAEVDAECVFTLEDLEKLVDDAEDGADEIELGFLFKAVQKSGKWYNVLKFDEQINDKGIGRDKLAKYVYDLYQEEV
jgi:hypothetical protein